MDVLASILIVNYNGATHLPACLTALERQTLPRHSFEVLLVDNASKDGSVGLVRGDFPWVRLLPLRHNHGFAEGTNIAARASRGRVLVLLNNDTIPDSYWLEELLSSLPRTGMATSKLVFAHDPRLMNGSGLFLLRDGRGADRGFRRQDVGRFERAEPVFAGCGAALAVPSPAAGTPILDPNYFLYYEDLDAGWRSRLGGKGPTYAPRSLVRHVHGAAAGDRSPVFHFHVERNRALTALRNGDPFLAAWSIAVLVGKLPRAVARHARGRESRSTVLAVGRAILAFTRWAPRILTERFTTRQGTGRCGS